VVIRFNGLIKTQKGRRWLTSNIHRVYHFRQLYNQLREKTNTQEHNKIEAEMRHLNKKIDQLTLHGQFLGFSTEQIKNINLLIIEEIKKGRKPEAIIQQFIDRS